MSEEKRPLAEEFEDENCSKQWIRNGSQLVIKLQTGRKIKKDKVAVYGRRFGSIGRTTGDCFLQRAQIFAMFITKQRRRSETKRLYTKSEVIFGHKIRRALPCFDAVE